MKRILLKTAFVVAVLLLTLGFLVPSQLLLEALYNGGDRLLPGLLVIVACLYAANRSVSLLFRWTGLSDRRWSIFPRPTFGWYSLRSRSHRRHTSERFRVSPTLRSVPMNGPSASRHREHGHNSSVISILIRVQSVFHLWLKSLLYSLLSASNIRSWPDSTA